MKFGKFLKQTRKQKGQTQEQAAAAIDVSVSTWMNWERGGAPNFTNIFKVADWAGVTVDEMRSFVAEETVQEESA